MYSQYVKFATDYAQDQNYIFDLAELVSYTGKTRRDKNTWDKIAAAGMSVVYGIELGKTIRVV